MLNMDTIMFFVVTNLVLWVVTAVLWGIDKLMNRRTFKIGWADCGQIICFIDTVILIYSFIYLSISLIMGIYLETFILLLALIPVLSIAFLGGVIWKFANPSKN